MDHLLYSCLHAFDEVFFGNTQAQPLDLGDERSGVVGGGVGNRGGIPRIVASDSVHDQGGVGDISGEGTNLVEGAGKGNQPVAANPAISRLEAYDAAEARRLADAASGVGTQGIDGLSGGHTCRWSPTRPPRNALRVPRVSGRAEGGVLVG